MHTPPVFRPSLPAQRVAPQRLAIDSLINHVVLVVDSSGSMQHLKDEVIKVLDSQIAHLASLSKEMDQETRVSVYLFADEVNCLVYDKDVLRLPSLARHYDPRGTTVLIDGTLKAIDELEATATLHGDHAFLVYVLTDGEERDSDHTAKQLSARINALPGNWTLAVLVPDRDGVAEARRFGFPGDNIQVWAADSARGVREVGEVLRGTTKSYMTARAAGVRGTKTLFRMDTAALTRGAVQRRLDELSPDQYHLLTVHRKAVIKPFIESWKIPFVPGSAYYQLTKPERVQGYKQVCIQHKATGRVYSGADARRMLGLPDHEVTIAPASHPDYDLFVQSQSFNRNLVGGTKLLVLR